MRAIQTCTAAPMVECARLLLTGDYKGIITQSQIDPSAILEGTIVKQAYQSYHSEVWSFRLRWMSWRNIPSLKSIHPLMIRARSRVMKRLAKMRAHALSFHRSMHSNIAIPRININPIRTSTYWSHCVCLEMKYFSSRASASSNRVLKWYSIRYRCLKVYHSIIRPNACMVVLIAGCICVTLLSTINMTPEAQINPAIQP